MEMRLGSWSMCLALSLRVRRSSAAWISNLDARGRSQSLPTPQAAGRFHSFATVRSIEVSLSPTAGTKRSRVGASFFSTSETSSVGRKEDSKNRPKPFFKVFYNDVYEVPLPPRHRFPMKKYAQVRQEFQRRLSALPASGEKEGVDCGTIHGPQIVYLVRWHTPH